MSSNKDFDQLLEAMWDMNIAKKVNALLVSMGTPTLEPEGLKQTIADLSANARKALVQAIKNKKVEKIVGILGITPITYTK
jgi:hypothetical protein